MMYAMLLSVLMSFGSSSNACFTPLGDLPGGDFDSSGARISSDGSAIVGIATDESGLVPFRWTERDGMVPIPLPVGSTGIAWSQATSCGGTIVAGHTATGAVQQVFAWCPVSEPVLLGDLPGGTGNVYVSDISANGGVIIGDSQRANGGFYEIFVWSADDGFVGLGQLPGASPALGSGGYSGGCDDSGDYVVGSSSSTEGVQAVRWSATDGMIGLGDLDGGIFLSHAWSVSEGGEFVVGTANSAIGPEAFRWSQAKGMEGLGIVPGGVDVTRGYDISADGSTIVGIANHASGSDGDAMIWTVEHGMQLLQDVLINEHGLGEQLKGWRLIAASTISADGTRITGRGLNPDGFCEAYMVELPLHSSADIDGDGVVGTTDLLKLLAAWGRVFP